jgi:heat shock protein HtpX
MPLTFIDIERQKSWRISALFVFLLFMYFILTLALVQGFAFLIPGIFLRRGCVFAGGNTASLLVILVFSVVIASLHFWFSAHGAVKAVMEALGALPPDREDGVHKQLMNIMEEIHVATGDRRRIECMVIPSLSMNALAVEDLNGRTAIAITEGLLSRLTRPQLESVVAHEAYHILSGDCMETTVTASIFGVYASTLEGLRKFGDDDFRGFPPAFLLFWILLKLSQLLRMFVSREREYRADAGSVRMTRDPVAMAEALRIISRNWTGVGFISRGLEMLCIANPDVTELDESEGWWADLMSTHPPTRKRMAVLLRMAHTSIMAFEEKGANAGPAATAPAPAETLYYALDRGHAWQGPFTFAELAALPWLSPFAWVASGKMQSVVPASELLGTLFAERAGDEGGESEFLCPLCKQRLRERSYEKTKVFECGYCGGILAENDKIPRILARREIPCTERIESLAKAVLADNQRKISSRRLKGAGTLPQSVMHCPKCRNIMFRIFFSLAYLIEIDRCNICGLTWFDKDELEMLQCIIENRITARIDEPGVS